MSSSMSSESLESSLYISLDMSSCSRTVAKAGRSAPMLLLATCRIFEFATSKSNHVPGPNLQRRLQPAYRLLKRHVSSFQQVINMHTQTSMSQSSCTPRFDCVPRILCRARTELNESWSPAAFCCSRRHPPRPSGTDSSVLAPYLWHRCSLSQDPDTLVHEHRPKPGMRQRPRQPLMPESRWMRQSIARLL